MTHSTFSRRSLMGGAGLAVAGLAMVRWPSPAEGASGGRFAVARSPAEWRRLLGPKRYAILRQAGTERPFSSPLDKERRSGRYACAGCANPLFSSAAKFDSGTGWPSFFRTLPRAILTREDRSLGMSRTEVLCTRCGGHLGHLFRDGPRPTGLRYCINGLALRFQPA